MILYCCWLTYWNQILKICQYLLKFPILEIKSQKITSFLFYSFIFSFSFLSLTNFFRGLFASQKWLQGRLGYGSSYHDSSWPSFINSVAAATSLGLCPLVFSFALYFWWMGSHPWFLFTRFFFMEESSKTLGSIVGSSIGGSLAEVRHILRPTFIYWRFIGGS